MSPGIDAVMTLADLGYRFKVNGETIKAKYHGPGEPDPEKVRPLLVLVKEHKPDILAYLSKSAMPERVLTCADCGFHKYAGPNPRQGWGHCALKVRGCYGIRAACEEAKCHQ